MKWYCYTCMFVCMNRHYIYHCHVYYSVNQAMIIYWSCNKLIHGNIFSAFHHCTNLHAYKSHHNSIYIFLIHNFMLAISPYSIIGFIGLSSDPVIYIYIVRNGLYMSCFVYRSMCHGVHCVNKTGIYVGHVIKPHI